MEYYAMQLSHWVAFMPLPLCTCVCCTCHCVCVEGVPVVLELHLPSEALLSCSWPFVYVPCPFSACRSPHASCLSCICVSGTHEQVAQVLSRNDGALRLQVWLGRGVTIPCLAIAANRGLHRPNTYTPVLQATAARGLTIHVYTNLPI